METEQNAKLLLLYLFKCSKKYVLNDLTSSLTGFSAFRKTD